MEGELWSLSKVVLYTTTALYYSNLLVSKLPSGKPRLVALLPVFVLFSLLPFSFSFVSTRVNSVLFLTWLGNFKLILFAYSKGQFSDQTLSFPVFATVIALPINVKPARPEPKSPRAVPLLVYAVKGLIISLLTSHYPNRHSYPRVLVDILYTMYFYLSVELFFALVTVFARVALLGTKLELEPHFSSLWQSTSLQNFWGRRWNLTVSRTVHSVIYNPVQERWGTYAGVMAAFSVSGVMHDVLFYYVTFQKPTGETTCLFFIHGVCVAAEIAAKKALRRKGWRAVPTVVAAPAAVGFTYCTSLWLMFWPFVAAGAGDKVIDEFVFMAETGKRAAAAATGFSW